MPNWLCPECGGGFPEPTVSYDTREPDECCPWCGEGLFVGDYFRKDD